MTLRARMSAVIGFLCLLAIAIGLVGLYGMNKSNEGLKAVYEDRTKALERVSRIDILLVQNRLAIAEALLNPIATEIDADAELIKKIPRKSPGSGTRTWPPPIHRRKRSWRASST